MALREDKQFNGIKPNEIEIEQQALGLNHFFVAQADNSGQLNLSMYVSLFVNEV